MGRRQTVGSGADLRAGSGVRDSDTTPYWRRSSLVDGFASLKTQPQTAVRSSSAGLRQHIWLAQDGLMCRHARRRTR